MIAPRRTLLCSISLIAVLCSGGMARDRFQDPDEEESQFRDSDRFHHVHTAESPERGYWHDRARDPKVARMVQVALQKRGFYNGRIDGMVGPESRSAIRNYKSSKGMARDGFVDERLLRALGLL